MVVFNNQDIIPLHRNHRLNMIFYDPFMSVSQQFALNNIP